MSDPHITTPPVSPGGDQAAKKLGAKEKLLRDLSDKLEESRKLEEQSQTLSARADAVEQDDPEEAERLRREAWELEEKAKKLIRMAKRMQSGFFQGGAAGAGIGAGVAGGLGTLVGGLIGGVAAIPTTAVGLLVGAGTGAIHGPWVKLVEDTVREDEEQEGKGETE